MKKILAILLTVCLAFSVMCFQTDAATTTPTVYLDSVNGPRGESITVNAKIRNNPGIDYFKFKVHYDSSVLTMTSITSTLPEFTPSESIAANPQVASFVQAADMTENKTLFTMTFAVNKDATVGSMSEIWIEVCECYNQDDNDVALAVEKGIVTITCNHSYNSEITTPATYTHSGVKTFTCTKCNDSYTETIAQLTPIATSPVIEPIPTSSVSVGGTVSVDIKVKNNPGFNYIKLKIDYPSENMQLLSCTPKTSGTFQTSATLSAKPYVIFLSQYSNYTEDFTVATLTFKVTNAVESGKINITVSDYEAYNAASDFVAFCTNTGAVYINNSTPGDINGDGYIKGNDLTLLMKYLADWSVSVNTNNADCNGDGKIKGTDATLLAKYLAKWDVTLG